jgi:hypothetical protein
MSLFAEFNGLQVTEVSATIPYAGVWTLDAWIDDQIKMPAKGTLNLAGLSFVGTVETDFSGTFGMRTKVHLSAGANAWSEVLPAKSYHNDAGVKVLSIMSDLARETGETLGTVQLSRERLGSDFARASAPASRTMALISGDVELLDFDAIFKVATIATDDPTLVGIGSVLTSEHLRYPFLIRQINLELKAGALRMSCWGREVQS